jgi:membrane associated rhomboid family serine protease
MDESTVTTCYRHPDRATRLSCTTCGKPICAECSHDAAVGQKCPDCARTDERTRVVSGRSAVGRPSFQTSPVSLAIIAATSAIFLIGWLVPGAELWLLEHFALVRSGTVFADPDAYRIFTVALLHGSLMHLLFNMYALYLFGPRLEQQVGGPAFASLYVAAAGAGGLLSMVLGGAGISVGASGAIFGLFGAWLFVAWKMRKTPGGRAMFNQLGFLMAINIAMPFLNPNIDWLGHLGGFIAGVGIAWLWSVLAVGKTNARQIRTMVGSSVVVVVTLLAFLAV